MKRYIEYKSTKYDWLPQVPIHWVKKTIRSITELSSERRGNRQATLLSVYREYGVIKKSSRNDNHNVESEDLSGYKIVRIGDLVLNKMKMWQGSLGVSEYDGIVSPAYIVCHITESSTNRRYLHMLLRSAMFKTYYNRVSYGVRVGQWDMHYTDFKSLELFLPPRSEQDQIVRYLDWQVSKINKLIAAKKKQIVFLKECRKAVIDTAILHGMNKHTEEKDSGVYWLGRIPASWEVLSLRRICSINASISHLIKKLPSDELVVFLPMESVSTEGIVDCSQKKPLHEVRTGYSSFARNDVVVAKITPCFENGKGACLDKLDTEIGFGTTEFINIRASEKVLPQYLYYITITQPFRILGAEVMTGSAGQKRISTDFIKNFTLGIPDIKEQQELLNILNDNLLKIDNAIKLVASTIDKLQEYRTRLISDAVTGQIDVRGIEIPDYEYVEEESDEETDETEGADEEVEEQEE